MHNLLQSGNLIFYHTVVDKTQCAVVLCLRTHYIDFLFEHKTLISARVPINQGAGHIILTPVKQLSYA